MVRLASSPATSALAETASAYATKSIDLNFIRLFSLFL